MMLDKYNDRPLTNDNSTRPGLCSCLALLASLALNGGLCRATYSPDAGRPNIIIVMADDMGFSDLDYSIRQDDQKHTRIRTAIDASSMATHYHRLYVLGLCGVDSVPRHCSGGERAAPWRES